MKLMHFELSNFEMIAPPESFFCLFHQNIFYIFDQLGEKDRPLFVVYSDQTAGRGNTINPVLADIPIRFL